MYTIYSVIFLVTTSTVCCYRYREVDLINRMNKFFGFDHNIFVVDSKTDHSSFIPLTSSLSYSEALDVYNNSILLAQTVYSFNNNFEHNETNLMKFIKSINDDRHRLNNSVRNRGKKTFVIVIVESLKFRNGSELNLIVEVRRLQRLFGINVNVKIGVVFTGVVNSTDTIKEFLRVSYYAGIVNIFTTFYLSTGSNEESFNVFKYNSFGSFSLVNVTESECPLNYFSDNLPNFQKLPLRLIRIADMPCHIGTRFWDTVFHVFNASKQIINISSVDIQRIYEPEVGYWAFLENKAGLASAFDRIYPFEFVTKVLLVPHAQPHLDFSEYIKNSTTWQYIFIYIAIVIVASTFVIIAAGYLRKQKLSLFQSTTNVINLLMNDNGAIRYTRLHRADVFVIVPLTFAGMIAVNGILSIFQSYLTVPIYEPQINTINDLYKSPFRILTEKNSWAKLTIETLQNRSKHGGWKEKVIAMETFNDIEKHLKAFNNTLAFELDDSNARVAVLAQKRSSLEAYHLMTDYLAKYLCSFYIQDNRFTERINGIVHRLQNAGIFGKWIQESDELYAKSFTKNKSDLQYKAFNKSTESDNSLFVPTIIWYGWIASGIVFIFEIVWHKFTSLSIKTVLYDKFKRFSKIEYGNNTRMKMVIRPIMIPKRNLQSVQKRMIKQQKRIKHFSC